MKAALSEGDGSLPDLNASLAESEYLVLHCLAASEGGASTAKQLARRLSGKPYNRPELRALYLLTVLSRLADRGLVLRVAQERKAVGRPGFIFQAVEPLSKIVERRAERALWSVAFGEPSSLQVVRDVLTRAIGQAEGGDET